MKDLWPYNPLMDHLFSYLNKMCGHGHVLRVAGVNVTDYLQSSIVKEIFTESYEESSMNQP